MRLNEWLDKLLFWRGKVEKRETKKMSKKRVVKFKLYGDAIPPAKTEWGVAIRTSVPIEVRPESSTVINLQVSPVDLPILIVAPTTIHGCNQTGEVVMPGQIVRLLLKNDQKRPLTIEARQVVLYAIPLGGDEFDVECSE